MHSSGSIVHRLTHSIIKTYLLWVVSSRTVSRGLIHHCSLCSHRWLTARQKLLRSHDRLRLISYNRRHTTMLSRITCAINFTTAVITACLLLTKVLSIILRYYTLFICCIEMCIRDRSFIEYDIMNLIMIV